ncbi:MAG: hypothetical protein WCS06_08445, partial [Dysgonamonadaceae bacterium]
MKLGIKAEKSFISRICFSSITLELTEVIELGCNHFEYGCLMFVTTIESSEILRKESLSFAFKYLLKVERNNTSKQNNILRMFFFFIGIKIITVNFWIMKNAKIISFQEISITIHSEFVIN